MHVKTRYLKVIALLYGPVDQLQPAVEQFAVVGTLHCRDPFGFLKPGEQLFLVKRIPFDKKFKSCIS
jgi:hypothetical protein